MISGIHHVSMKCGTPEELQAVKDFYCSLLGMKIAREWPEGILIESGCGMIEVFCNGEGIRTKGAIRHLALAVDDADACADAVRQAGYTVFTGPKNIEMASDPPLRARMAFCFGPLGEEIEFFCEEKGGEE